MKMLGSSWVIWSYDSCQQLSARHCGDPELLTRNSRSRTMTVYSASSAAFDTPLVDSLLLTTDARRSALVDISARPRERKRGKVRKVGPEPEVARACRAPWHVRPWRRGGRAPVTCSSSLDASTRPGPSRRPRLVADRHLRLPTQTRRAGDRSQELCNLPGKRPRPRVLVATTKYGCACGLMFSIVRSRIHSGGNDQIVR